MTPAQCRAARALLHMTLRDVALRAGVSPNTTSQFEASDLSDAAAQRAFNPATLTALRVCFEAQGVDFAGDGSHGVRLRDGAELPQTIRRPSADLRK